MINGEKLIYQPLVMRVGKLTLYIRGKRLDHLEAGTEQLSSGGAWEMKADLNQQMAIPPHIVSTNKCGF